MSVSVRACGGVASILVACGRGGLRGTATTDTGGLLHVMVGEMGIFEDPRFPTDFSIGLASFTFGAGTIKALTVTGDLLTRSRLAPNLTNGVGDRVNTLIGPEPRQGTRAALRWILNQPRR